MTIYKKAKEYGIYGYILKEHAQTELEKCLVEVAKGNKYVSEFLEDDLISDKNNSTDELSKLTLSERKIVELIIKQKTSKQIAELLFYLKKQLKDIEVRLLKNWVYPKKKTRYSSGQCKISKVRPNINTKGMHK